MSRATAFSSRLHVPPAKSQINMRIRAVWSESWQGTLRVAKDPKCLLADSEDSDQSVWIRKLVCVFSGRTYNLVGNIVPWLILSYCYAEGMAWEKWIIMKTYLYNVDPVKPHFYIVKLGFAGVYSIFFLFLLKNIDCGYSLEPPRRGGSNEYPQSMFWAEIWKISESLFENFHFFCGKLFSMFE